MNAFFLSLYDYLHVSDSFLVCSLYLINSESLSITDAHHNHEIMKNCLIVCLCLFTLGGTEIASNDQIIIQ